MRGVLWFDAAPAIDVEKLKVFVLHKLHHELKPGPYVVVYFHTAVQRNDNSPGLWALRDLYEILPKQLKHGLQAVYVVHPGLRFRLFLGTLGRFFLSEGYVFKSSHLSPTYTFLGRVSVRYLAFLVVITIALPETLNQHCLTKKRHGFRGTNDAGLGSGTF